jgi:hypothetical protein
VLRASTRTLLAGSALLMVELRYSRLKRQVVGGGAKRTGAAESGQVGVASDQGESKK